MSDNIPFDLQIEIMKILPVKSLIQFRSVSKTWKSLIDSTEFITYYSLHNTQPKQLYSSQGYIALKHNVSNLTFLDDRTSVQHRIRFAPTISLSLECPLINPAVIGSSHGLLCLHCSSQDSQHFKYENHRAVIWNPSIRKSVVLNLSFSRYDYVMGFGVCPVTCDPTIVEIYEDDDKRRLVRVFRLSTGAWKNPSKNLRNDVGEIWCQAVVDKFIYWAALNTDRTCNLVLSFDMTNDEFRVVDLPGNLSRIDVSVSKLRESLVVLGYPNYIHCDVWLMETGAQESLTKLFSIEEPYAYLIDILGFNKTGDPIMRMEFQEEYGMDVSHVVYDASSKLIDDLGINEVHDIFYENSFMETLLLLDQRELNL